MTENQTDPLPTAAVLARALDRLPGVLAPLGMIIGFTHNELAVAAKLHQPGLRIAGGSIKNLERRPRPAQTTGRRRELIEAFAATVVAVMAREPLDVPPAAAGSFHPKLDKQDTRAGWAGVADSAGAAPTEAAVPALRRRRLATGAGRLLRGQRQQAA